MRRFLTLLVCAAALVATAADRRAPGFSLVDTKLQEHDLADYRGKVVLLTFVSTTCPHCAAFAEILQQVQDKHPDKVQVLAVVTPPDDFKNAREFIQGHKITFPVLMDSGQMSYSYILSPDLKFPRLYMIDGNGMIRADYEYSPVTREIFEGAGLDPAVSRMLGSGGTKK